MWRQGGRSRPSAGKLLVTMVVDGFAAETDYRGFEQAKIREQFKVFSEGWEADIFSFRGYELNTVAKFPEKCNVCGCEADMDYFRGDGVVHQTYLP